MFVGAEKSACKPSVIALVALCGLLVMIGAAFSEVAYADDALRAAEVVDPVDPSNPDPAPVLDGWVQNGTKWTYWESDVQVKGKWVDTEVAPIAGGTAGMHRYWIDANGNLAVSRLINTAKNKDKLAGYCAYATEFGYVAMTKTVVGNKIYLVKGSSKKPGLLESGNKKAGRLYTSKYTSGSKKHFYYISKKSHAVITGKAVKIKGYGWVYNLPKKGYALTGITKFDKTHLVLADKYGRLCRQKKGLLKSDAYHKTTHWYYIEKTKANKNVFGARIGEFKAEGVRYQGLKQGYLFTDGYKIYNGKYYHADSRGCITYDSVVNGLIRKAAGYWSPSRYLLMVDIDNPRVMVFEGYQGNWKVKYIWKCCTGKPSTPTITGRFSIGAKGHSFGEDHGYACYYWSEISGDYLFHSRKYYPYTHKLMDSRIGRRCSMGCVRLYDSDAIWIQRNCPSGTTVVCTR